MIIGVRKWAIVATLLVAACSGMGVAIGTWRSTPSPCLDTVLLKGHEAEWGCSHPAARLSVEVTTAATTGWLYRCTCPHDGGTP